MERWLNKILLGNAPDVLMELPDKSIHCCVTSPPYWGLRDYGVEGQLGLEKTPEEYVQKMVDLFREVRRVLRDDGTLWLNLGDTYAAGGLGPGSGKQTTNYGSCNGSHIEKPRLAPMGLKPKDLVGIPWRVAFALQADGWYLRSDIIWCLSGGTKVYARTQKGDAPMTIKDLARLDPSTVKLWNGEKWTQLLGVSKSTRRGDEITLVLRSGERISCTPTHKFPTRRGLLEAKDIVVGDILERCVLPEPDQPKEPAFIGEDAAWLAGLYVAEGSRSGDTIQIAGHAKETERWERLQAIAVAYGGYATLTIDENRMDIRLYGKVLNAVIDELVSGRTAKDKHFSPVVWRYSNRFLEAILDGYLAGDGHYDAKNDRWRLGFTRNYNLESDLRTICARLGYKLKLNLSHVTYNGKRVPTFRGEIRKTRSGHWNEKDPGEIVAIQKARCREVYDLGVADDPHLFALASGALTHNSKPNPMPESVKDRPTKAHEYIFLLAKNAQYYYDYEAILEAANYDGRKDTIFKGSLKYDDETLARVGGERWPNKIRDYKTKDGGNGQSPQHHGADISTDRKMAGRNEGGGGTGFARQSGGYDMETGEWLGGMIGDIPARNKRSVWTVNTKPFKEAHFATFPPKLIEPCILAGCPENGIVLDPFIGSGTVAQVATLHRRNWIGIELNPEYIKLADKRRQVTPRLL
jgi:DNA modification methylase